MGQRACKEQNFEDSLYSERLQKSKKLARYKTNKTKISIDTHILEQLKDNRYLNFS